MRRVWIYLAIVVFLLGVVVPTARGEPTIPGEVTAETATDSLKLWLYWPQQTWVDQFEYTYWTIAPATDGSVATELTLLIFLSKDTEYYKFVPAQGWRCRRYDDSEIRFICFTDRLSKQAQTFGLYFYVRGEPRAGTQLVRWRLLTMAGTNIQIPFVTDVLPRNGTVPEPTPTIVPTGLPTAPEPRHHVYLPQLLR